MKDSVVKYAAVISKVLNVDVEILDSRMRMVAGTGRYHSMVNQYISPENHHIYQKILATGKKYIVENPRENPVCQDCPERLGCVETYDMSAPIVWNGEVIGVIGFVCTTQDQKNHIVDNGNVFNDFLDQIVDLIVLKASENEDQERNLRIIQFMNEIIDTIEEGVIIFDNKGHVSRVNERAKQFLGVEMKRNQLIRIQLQPTETKILDLDEYQIRVNGSVFNVIGREYTISNSEYSKVFLFKDPESLREKAMELSVTKEQFSMIDIVGKSKGILAINEKVKKIAKNNSSVLITGESGTGKELYARAIHNESAFSNGPFIAVNCAAIPENLLESEMFGYEKGAFTGADPKGKIGKFELANNGTIFLDEIGDMPLYIQVKLLRVLGQREIIRLGSNRPIKVNARIIAATNKNLEEMVENSSFREDLYYRLNVIPIYVPPIRERSGDIELLAQNYIDKFSGLFHKKVVTISPDFWNAVNQYSWPGNVRELQNVMEYVINMMGEQGELTVDLLPVKVKDEQKGSEFSAITMDDFEREFYQQAISLYGKGEDPKKEIAEKLGIGIATLYRKLKKYNLKV